MVNKKMKSKVVYNAKDGKCAELLYETRECIKTDIKKFLLSRMRSAMLGIMSLAVCASTIYLMAKVGIPAPDAYGAYTGIGFIVCAVLSVFAGLFGIVNICIALENEDAD